MLLAVRVIDGGGGHHTPHTTTHRGISHPLQLLIEGITQPIQLFTNKIMINNSGNVVIIKPFMLNIKRNMFAY